MPSNPPQAVDGVAARVAQLSHQLKAFVLLEEVDFRTRHKNHGGVVGLAEAQHMVPFFLSASGLSVLVLCAGRCYWQWKCLYIVRISVS